MKVLTANRLADGQAVWFAKDETWAETIGNVRVANDKDDEAILQSIGETAHAKNLVVDVNLIDVDLVCGNIVPSRLRERIRAAGPTNRHDLGKQAQPNVNRAA